MPKDFHKRATDRKRVARLRWEIAEGITSSDYISSSDDLAKAGAMLRVKNGAVVPRGTNKKKRSQREKIKCPECKCNLLIDRLERHLLRAHQYPAKITEKLVAKLTPALPLSPVDNNQMVNCPKCGISVRQSNLDKHLATVHKAVPGVIPSPFVQKKPVDPVSALKKSIEPKRELKPVAPLIPDPPGPEETLPTIVRCGICRQHVKYANLLAHYSLSHVRELPAFTDNTCS